jgi:hypothetical protein
MPYLDKTIHEITKEITAVCDSVKNADEKETAQEMDRIEKLIREKLTESFKNGIEVGKKESNKNGTKVRK